MFENIYFFLNRLMGLSFEDNFNEKRFQIEYQNDHIGQNKIAILAGLIAYICYLPVAYLFTPEDFYIAFTIITVPIFLSIVFLFMIRKRKFRKNLLLNLFTYGIGIGLPPIVVLIFTQHYQQVYINNYLLVIFSVFIMYGIPFIISVLTISILITSMLIVLFLSPINFENIVYDLFLIIVALMISVISGYLIEQSKRKNYLAKYHQEELNKKLLKEQQKVRQKDKQLLKSKLEQMGEMISMIAHQWRQPLNAISATTNNLTFKLMMDDIDKENFAKELELIAGYSQHLSVTIDDFRNFYKKDRIKENTTLKDIVNSTLDIVRVSLESKGISINTNFICDDKIYLNSSEVKQVILNLIKNSQDILLENKIKNPYIKIDIKCDDKNQIVTISDNGGGVPKSIKDKIFDPYFSTKKKKDGTGLGLYMSKTIIEDHCNGKLNVTNIKNGAVFTITLQKDLKGNSC